MSDISNQVLFFGLVFMLWGVYINSFSTYLVGVFVCFFTFFPAFERRS